MPSVRLVYHESLIILRRFKKLKWNLTSYIVVNFELNILSLLSFRITGEDISSSRLPSVMSQFSFLLFTCKKSKQSVVSNWNLLLKLTRCWENDRYVIEIRQSIQRHVRRLKQQQFKFRLAGANMLVLDLIGSQPTRAQANLIRANNWPLAGCRIEMRLSSVVSLWWSEQPTTGP